MERTESSPDGWMLPYMRQPGQRRSFLLECGLVVGAPTVAIVPEAARAGRLVLRACPKS